MFVHMSIHTPRKGKERDLIESMHRFGNSVRGKPGCRLIHSLKDQKTGRLIGLAIWDSKEEWLAQRPVMEAAVEGDPFEEWEFDDPEVFHLDEV